MRTDSYNLRKNSDDYKIIPEEAERTARYIGLDERSSLRLRLLSEEMVCMLPRLLSIGSGEFYVETRGSRCELHLRITPTDMSDVDRDQILAISTSGKNAAAKGIIGKIWAAVEVMLDNQAKVAKEMPFEFYEMGMSPEYNVYQVWSLNNYRDNVRADEELRETAEWDELEKSILGKVADDVTVGIMNGVIEITVVKSF
ncbi:MAG: hypothetical protein J6F31_04515 [Oscillospiraceae bacterium]|nr:hypothetical protein [Oscillospiraceae bacterium]